jgi:hypothetical protein
MIPNDQPLREQTIRTMIAILLENTKTLTKWEEDFIDSIDEQFIKKGDLSGKQCAVLERIYDNL